jgi:hypothetical protein
MKKVSIQVFCAEPGLSCPSVSPPNYEIVLDEYSLSKLRKFFTFVQNQIKDRTLKSRLCSQGQQEIPARKRRVSNPMWVLKKWWQQLESSLYIEVLELPDRRASPQIDILPASLTLSYFRGREFLFANEGAMVPSPFDSSPRVKSMCPVY